MPLMVAQPIALAAFLVIAIGLISYNLITNKKKKIPVRKRCIEYVADYQNETRSRDHPGVRKRSNANTETKQPSSGKTESENESSTYSNRKFPDASPGPSVEKESLFNNLDSLDQNKDENRKLQNIVHNIYQEDSEKLDATKTALDEDAESSVSNVSVANANDLGSFEDLKSKGSSQENISEKLYKREVCERLRNEVETMSLRSLADSNLSENDDEDDRCSFRSWDNGMEKPIICKGCEESYANAVAQPCGHQYLCLDCAIKVHRIHRKCSVCNFHIETYDIYNPQET